MSLNIKIFEFLTLPFSDFYKLALRESYCTVMTYLLELVVMSSLYLMR